MQKNWSHQSKKLILPIQNYPTYPKELSHQSKYLQDLTDLDDQTISPIKTNPKTPAPSSSSSSLWSSQSPSTSLTSLYLYRGGVPDQEDTALPLAHQQVCRILPRHRSEVPAERKWLSDDSCYVIFIFDHMWSLTLPTYLQNSSSLHVIPIVIQVPFRWIEEVKIMRLTIFEEQFNSHQRTNAIILRRLCAIPKDATDKFRFLHSQKKSIWI